MRIHIQTLVVLGSSPSACEDLERGMSAEAREPTVPGESALKGLTSHREQRCPPKRVSWDFILIYNVFIFYTNVFRWYCTVEVF